MSSSLPMRFTAPLAVARVSPLVRPSVCLPTWSFRSELTWIYTAADDLNEIFSVLSTLGDDVNEVVEAFINELPTDRK
ncbi:hypothetical protein OBBRIDRAFT_796099 [Obba rivulosa]|uniref:Uncharacterized protein n=1 Tax=Obba rivulosa TaxID=1052685 RepID=A0A8E2AN36_9APHY|nr:hypothetical protein OBBRIDRAFT_796099 [Obba rivulosa]